MTKTVNQPTAMPTRKLTASVIIAACWDWLGLVVQNLFPDWYDPTVWTNTEPVLLALVGYYLVKDGPNVGSNDA